MAHPTDNPQRDIIIESGSTFTMVVTWTGNVSGQSFAMKGRPSHGSSTVVFELSTLEGDISATHSGGETTITVTMAATVTAGFTAPQYGVYDLEATLSGVTTRIAEGTFYVTPNATR
jgi:hypothetical protein